MLCTNFEEPTNSECTYMHTYMYIHAYIHVHVHLTVYHTQVVYTEQVQHSPPGVSRRAGS